MESTVAMNITELSEFNSLIEEMYLSEKDFLEQMPKEMLMYIHFKTIGKDKMGGKIEKYSLESFKSIIEKNEKFRNSDKRKVLNELFEYLGFNELIMPIKRLSIEKIFNKAECENFPYYRSLKEIADGYFENFFNNEDIIFDSEFQEKLLIEVNKKFLEGCHSYNLFIIICLFKKTLIYMDTPDYKTKALIIMRFFLIKLLRYNEKINEATMKAFTDVYGELSEARKQVKIRIEEVSKLKAIIKEYTKDKKTLEKQVIDKSLQFEDYMQGLTVFTKSIDNKLPDMEDLIKEVRSIKSNIVKNTYDNIINNLNDKISDLKSLLIEKSKTINSLKKENQSYLMNTPAKILKEHIDKNGLTDDIIEILSPFIQNITVVKEDITEIKGVIYNDKKDRAGYCFISNNKHYIKLPNGNSLELKRLPEGTYLAQGQIVLASYDGEFKYAFQYTSESIGIQPEHILTIVHTIDGTGIHVGFNGEYRELKNVPKDVNLKQMQVVLVDKDYNYIRIFRKLYLNADTLLTSIKSKGHEAYFIVKILDDSNFLLRNIETKEEQIKYVNANKFYIQPHSVITVKEDEVISHFPTGKFYTMSSLYNRNIYAIVEHRDGESYAKVLGEEEHVKILDIPSNRDMEDGAVIKLDEYGNFLEVLNDYVTGKRIDRRKVPRTVKNSDEKEVIKIKGKILIIGNISYEQSYMSAFIKKGYQVEVIDGFEPWSKISKSLKEKDLIIVIVNFISHDNMFRVKDKSIPIIFSEYDGANRLIGQTEDKLEPWLRIALQ